MNSQAGSNLNNRLSPERSAGELNPGVESRNVRIGEIVVAEPGQTLRTLLGSCVGLALVDRVVHRGGLAHIVLPSSSGHVGPRGKFADTAVQHLIELLEGLGCRSSALEARIAGGSQMLASSGSNAIGQKNVSAVTEQLEQHGIPIVGRHCGGERGRRMLFCSASGRTRIEIVGSDVAEI